MQNIPQRRSRECNIKFIASSELHAQHMHINFRARQLVLFSILRAAPHCLPMFLAHYWRQNESQSYNNPLKLKYTSSSANEPFSLL